MAARSSCIKAFRSCSRFFRMEIDLVATVHRYHEEEMSVPFLDIALYPFRIANGNYLLKTKAYTKPTSLWTPLSYTSTHHPAVHLMWPPSVLRRLRDHCTDDASYDEAKRAFMQRLRVFAPGHPGLLATTARPRRRQPSSSTCFCVLPFHPIWHHSGIHSACESMDAMLAAHSSYQVRISWSLAGSHLMRLVQAYNIEKSTAPRGRR